MPPPTTLDAAIVICAYTQARWDDTIAAIASAMAQAPSSGVVVVVDHEDALFQRLVEADTGARVIQSAGPRGLSGARNTGVAAVEADVVAFLDDDARAEPGWLDALLRPYEDASVVATGGRIVPVFDGGRPSWLAEELDWIVGCTYRGMPRVQADVRNVIGAGMSVRRAAFEAVGGFDTSLGRGLGLPVGGEETTLCIRARRLVPGARVVFEPAASVSHRVPSGRRTIGYALRRAWAEGLTKARVARLEGPSASLSTERAYVARILPAAVLRELWDAVGRRDASALGRAAVIVAVLGAASVGFAAERVAQAAGKLRASARLPRAATSRPDGRDATAGDRPLRILQVTPRYDPFVGGVETHTQEVARRLAARGHRVTVLTTDPGASLPRRERVDGVEIVRVRAFPATRDWYLAPGLVAMIGRPRWDVVHIQGVHTLVPPLGALTAILASRRFVLTFHTGGHSSRVRTSARSLQWRLLAPILRRAAALVAVSRFEAEQFAEAFGIANDRIELIRNGSEAGTPGALAAPGTDMLSSIPDGAPLILSPGRLERYKGHHRVVAAMPAVREALPDARLHLAGTGAYEPDLRRQVAELGLEEAVTIGPIARERMPDAFARASVVALLSEYESHPVAVMEALAARRRVVVADTSGFRELAEDGLVRAIPLDACPDDAAAAILHELDRAAPESGPPLPTWDDTTDRLEALYRRIVGA